MRSTFLCLMLAAVLFGGCAADPVFLGENNPPKNEPPQYEPPKAALEMLPKQQVTTIATVSLPPESRFVMPSMYFLVGFPPVQRHTPKPTSSTPEEVLNSFLKGTVLEEGKTAPPGTEGPVWHRVNLPATEEAGPPAELRYYGEHERTSAALKKVGTAYQAGLSLERQLEWQARQKFYGGLWLAGSIIFLALALAGCVAWKLRRNVLDYPPMPLEEIPADQEIAGVSMPTFGEARAS